MVGTTGFAGEATRLAHMTEEATEVAFLKNVSQTLRKMVAIYLFKVECDGQL
jgi:1,4-dihydroxy-2-naphthoyl-CoA synthase